MQVSELHANILKEEDKKVNVEFGRLSVLALH